jgi:hypothetical protein
VRYIVINGSNLEVPGNASTIDFLYEIALSIDVIGVLVFGMTIALPKYSDVK